MKNLVNIISDYDLIAGRGKMPKGHTPHHRAKPHGGKYRSRKWTAMKNYKFRRAAVKRGELGEIAQFGHLGHSRYLW